MLPTGWDGRSIGSATRNRRESVMKKKRVSRRKFLEQKLKE